LFADRRRDAALKDARERQYLNEAAKPYRVAPNDTSLSLPNDVGEYGERLLDALLRILKDGVAAFE
jgi:hypothetical protein